MDTSKVGKRGQVTIPSNIRRRTGLQVGDQVAFLPHGEYILLKPLTGNLLNQRGSIEVSEPQDFNAIRKEVLSRPPRGESRHEP